MENVTIDIPCSKSYAQRYIICACLFCDEPAILHNMTLSKDIVSCIDSMRMLGAEIKEIDGDIYINKGIAPNKNLCNTPVNVGESGTTCRILLPILSTMKNMFTIYGDGSLNKRNMSSISQIVDENPVYYNYKVDKEKLPIEVFGDLIKNSYVLDGSDTSQYISGLIIAYAYNKKPLNLMVNNCDSYRYVKITLDVLNEFGIYPKVESCDENLIMLTMDGDYMVSYNHEIDVEKDWSSFAAIYLASSLLGNGVTINGMNIESTQADSIIWKHGLELFHNITVGENSIDIAHIDKVNRFDIDISKTPDLFPYYAGFAAMSDEYCKISGLHKLVNKESNRGVAIYEEFKKLGIDCYIDEDSIYIKKGDIKDAVYDSHNDHRIGQVLMVIKLLVGGHIKNNDGCIDKSYPNFINDIKKIYGKQIRTFF